MVGSIPQFECGLLRDRDWLTRPGCLIVSVQGASTSVQHTCMLPCQAPPGCCQEKCCRSPTPFVSACRVSCHQRMCRCHLWQQPGPAGQPTTCQSCQHWSLGTQMRRQAPLSSVLQVRGPCCSLLRIAEVDPCQRTIQQQDLHTHNPGAVRVPLAHLCEVYQSAWSRTAISAFQQVATTPGCCHVIPPVAGLSAI